MEVREAHEHELDRLIEIHTSAFPDPRGHDARRSNFVANPLGPLSALHVVVDGGEPVGHGFLFDLDVWVAGAPVRCGAIASIGVAPEARGRGVAGVLLDALHARARARGALFTLLYPFRQAFYARHGYATVTPNRRYALHPASIPAAWRKTPGIVLRRARDERAAIEATYTRAAARATGWLVRPEALWGQRFGDERRTWVVAAREGAVVGYVAWSLVQTEAHASTRLAVHELCADDDEARRALLGAVGGMRDQAHEVDLETDARDPLVHALLDSDRARYGDRTVEHTLGAVVGGPMVRVTDVARALRARVRPEVAPFALVVDREVVLHGEASSLVPLETDRATFGALLFGGLAVRDACALGLVRARSADTLARVESALAHAPFLSLDAF